MRGQKKLNTWQYSIDPMDSENVTFMPKLSRPNFNAKSTEQLGFYRVKIGQESFGKKVTFPESSGSIEYCYVLDFSGPLVCLP